MDTFQIVVTIIYVVISLIAIIVLLVLNNKLRKQLLNKNKEEENKKEVNAKFTPDTVAFYDADKKEFLTFKLEKNQQSIVDDINRIIDSENAEVVSPVIEDKVEKPQEKEPEVVEDKVEEKVEEVIEEKVEERAEENPEEPVQEAEQPVEEAPVEEEKLAEEKAEETPEEPVQEAEQPVEEKEEEKAEPEQDLDEEESYEDTEDDSDSGDEKEEANDANLTPEEKAKLVIKSKTFEQKLNEGSDDLKKYYEELKKALEAKGLKGRRSKTAEKYRLKTDTLAQLKIYGKSISIFLALDPKDYEESKYKGQDASEKKATASTPFRYIVKTDRKLKWALELIDQLAEKNNLNQ